MPTVAGNDQIVLIDEQSASETEAAVRGLYLGHLLFGMRARIAPRWPKRFDGNMLKCLLLDNHSDPRELEHDDANAMMAK
jgi:hypothetical protein